jgi:predicted polyphosphate/ATP-dependent NAD kinase
MKVFKLGFIINPVAGIGGSVAFKGSDGRADEAIALGALPQANARASLALEILSPYKNDIVILTASGSMGEESALALGFTVEVVYECIHDKTQSIDSQLATKALLAKGTDIILFAGGDGTARDIAKVVTARGESQSVPVLGIPAGCKIHSGVYAITPKAAGRVIELMITKQLVSLTSGDVMDIDEELFRQGIVKAKRFGEMQIPSELRYVQAVKSGGKESDELVLQDIAANVIEEMHDFNDRQFIIGSGSTTAFVMSELGLDNTLLGVDIVTDQRLCAVDVTEADVFKAISLFDGVSKLVITLIGGQGHIFGRGNQQLSPRVIRAIITQPGGQDNIMILATKAKLTALANKPLISDTGDATLDQVLTGFIAVTTGYKDQVLYPISSPE